MAFPNFRISILTFSLCLAGPLGLVSCSEAERPDTRIKQEPVQKSSPDVALLASISAGFHVYNGTLIFSTVLLEVLNNVPSGSNTRTLETETLKMKLSEPKDKPEALEMEIEIPEISKTSFKLKQINSGPQAIHISLKKSYLQLLLLSDPGESQKIKIYIRSLPIPDENGSLKKWGLPTLVLAEKKETGFRFVSAVTSNKYQMEPSLSLAPPAELSEYGETQIQPIPSYGQ